MKSYETTALALYESILTDATIRWPHLRASFGKDLSYLRRAVKARGLSFLTITLPEAAKILYQDLDRGSQLSRDTSEYPQGYPLVPRTGRPKLFRDLLNLVFDVEGLLRSDADIEAVKFLIQLHVVCKNARLDCHPSKVKETLDEFFAIEEHLPSSHVHTWDCENPEWSERGGHPLWGYSYRYRGSEEQSTLRLDSVNSRPDSLDLPWHHLRAYARRVVGVWIGNYPEWELEPKHGPGAVSESKVGVKYDFPHWPRKLEEVFPFDWYGSGDLGSTDRPSDREPPSRLIAVPKSQKGPRLICAEPVAHQWIQQGIWRWLEQRIEKTPLQRSIRFRDQSLQQSRALSSSDRADLCTIDLSAASDRISTRLVEYLFQGSNLLEALHASRTRYMVQNISPDHPKMIVLKKFSTMGSAVTFPIQSLVFYILTTFAVMLQEYNEAIYDSDCTLGYDSFDWWKPEGMPEVSVFGDDIIAPVDAYHTIELVLHQCGLKVNFSKTFTGSNFRESCGMYAFRGVDVTPAYLLESYNGSPDSLAATIEASNNLHTAGYWYGAEMVAYQIPEAERKNLYVTGPDRVGGLGLVSFCGDGYHLHREVWDADLQRHYIKTLTVSSKARWVQGSGEASLSQYFFESPDPTEMLPYKSGKAGRSKLRKCFGQVLNEGGKA